MNNSWKKLGIAGLLLGTCAVLGWQLIGKEVLRLQFDEQQREMFVGITEQASDSLEQSPPDVASAIEALRRAHEYYPSGRERIEGSRLDDTIEWCRGITENDIIEKLVTVTGEDLGGDANDWIVAFSKRGAVPQ